MQNHYQILGVNFTATKAEIKHAYHQLALQWHPDKNKTPSTEEKFKKITAAYEVLNDPQKRAKYNQSLVAAGFISAFTAAFKKACEMELKRMAEDRQKMQNEQTTIKPEPDKLSSFSAANNQAKMGVFFATKKGDMVRTDAPNMS